MAIKVAVIGAGGMSNYHIPGFKSGGAKITAIVDVNEEAAKATAEKYKIPEVYTNVDEMLKKSDVDAVSVITPNKFHKPLVIKSLKAGKHVFCEKPPALNAAEMKAMAQAAKKANKLLVFDFNNRARPEAVAMKKAIVSGEVGKINSAQALQIRRTGIPGFGGWFTTKELSGGGPVIDLLHMIDLALYFMDYPDPDYVLAKTYDDFITDKRFKGPWGIPDKEGGVCDVESAAHGFVTFKDGSVLFLRTSWAEMNKREEASVTFQGTKAGGLVRRLFGIDGIDETAEDTSELYFVDAKGKRKDKTLKVKKDETMGRLNAAKNFILAIEGKEAPLNTPEQGIKLMKIIDAIYASSNTKAPVKIK